MEISEIVKRNDQCVGCGNKRKPQVLQQKSCCTKNKLILKQSASLILKSDVEIFVYAKRVVLTN